MIASWILLGLFLPPSGARAGSIFDDDWTPPSAVKPVEPPANTHPNRPAEPSRDPAVVNPPKTPETNKPDPTAKSPVSPTAGAQSKRRPVPGSADQAKSRKLFKELFAKDLADHSAAGRRALAGKLLDQAATVNDAPTDQFVLLVGAAQAGREGSDLSLLCRAADALADAYDVDGLRYKADAATKMSLRADSTATAADNCRAGLALADELIDADDYAAASHLLQALKVASPTAATSSEIAGRIKEVDARRAGSEHVAPFLEKLKTAPDDPAANLAVGQFLCFIKEDWESGLPLLSKGGASGSSATAALEMAAESNPQKQINVGDAWWNLAEKETGPTQLAIRHHAASLYSGAIDSGAIVGLKRIMLEKRVASVQRVINLLALIDLKRDVVQGKWRLKEGVLSCAGAKFSRIVLPYEPSAEYDFLIEFDVDDSAVVEIIATSRAHFQWAIEPGNNTFGFGIIDPASTHSDSARGSVPHLLSHQDRQISVVRVRRHRITATLNGKELAQYDTDFSDLHVQDVWSIGKDVGLGLGATERAVKFYRAEVIEITGKGKPILPKTP